VDDSISSDYKSTVFKTNNNVIGKLLPTYYHYFDPYLVIIIVTRVINITPRYSESQTLIDIEESSFFISSDDDSSLVGGIPIPLKNMKVSWDYYPQYMENMFHTTNHFIFCTHGQNMT
jgi:hypothetical protein